MLSNAFQTIELINREMVLMEQEVGKSLHEMALDDKRLVGWLEKYPELTETTPVDRRPFWRNKNWDAVAHFFNLEYWRRAWIFQEIVLAREALLVSKTSCVSWMYTIDRVFYWLWRVEKCKIPSPTFLAPSLWQYLTSYRLARSLPSKHLETVKRRRRVPPSPMRPWSMFKRASMLNATDPKDNVYALLGVTGIDVRVDYSEQTSVAKVYEDLTGAWLQEYASANNEMLLDSLIFGLEELWFLDFAGLWGDSML